MTSDELKYAAEYNRGYEDGKKAKSAGEWRLARDREDVVRKLEESKPLLGMTKTEILGDIGKAITNDPNFDPSDIDHLNLMWSTLIHLLGGDNGTCPNDDPIYADDFAMRPLPTPNRDFAKVAERSITITSELRDLVHSTQFEAAEDADPFIAIADRIDAQFARICEQQESVLQATIGQMCEERDKLQAVIDLKDRALDAALARLKDSIEPPKDRDGKTWHLGDEFVYEGNPVEVDALCLYDGEWMLQSDLHSTQFNAAECTHAPTTTAESIVRDLTLGNISESDAIARIEKLGSQHE